MEVTFHRELDALTVALYITGLEMSLEVAAAIIEEYAQQEVSRYDPMVE